MKVICLLQDKGLWQSGLKSCLGEVLDGAPVKYCEDLGSLLARMRESARYPDIVVLAETDPATLDKLVEQKELFADVSIVLLVPNDDKGTLAKGHLLRPRFVTSSGSDPNLVKEVLQNVVRRQRLENQIEALR